MLSTCSRAARVVEVTLMAAALGTVACGSSASATGPGSPPGDSGSPPQGAGGRSTAPDSGEPPVTTDGGTTRAVEAAKAVAETDPTCSSIEPFYWEIGDARGAIGSGSPGAPAVTASTDMSIASASKFVFGAYVVERFKDDLTAIDHAAMTMESGYTSLVYSTCVLSKSVQACFDAATNSAHTPANDGRFYYGGGHFQKYAIDLGLGADDSAKLSADIGALLGSELHVAYRSPQLAGGLHSTPADYAAFLRKILGRRLALANHLGEAAVCTLPGACATAAYSPAAPRNWHYSYGHWVEDDPSDGDGAFSSPGAFGFYPWIDASKRYYGIVARYSLATKAYVESAACGALVRKAFLGALP